MKLDWRAILARSPLPMLALAASWGVYSFQKLFVPEVFAIISAASFELVYIGMALVMTPDKRKATAISLGAVGVSVIYNTLAGLFHRNPEWLTNLPVSAEIGLSILHGLPLAGLAYLVADLLLHSQLQEPSIPYGSYSVNPNIPQQHHSYTSIRIMAPAPAAANSLPAPAPDLDLSDEPEPDEESTPATSTSNGVTVQADVQAAIIAAADDIERETGKVNRSEVCRRVFNTEPKGRNYTRVQAVLNAAGR